MTDINRTIITLSDDSSNQSPQVQSPSLRASHPPGPPFLTSPAESCQVGPLRLKVLIALQRIHEASFLSESLEARGCRVILVRELKEAIGRLQQWQPELVITGEGLGPNQPDGGLRLAEYCRWMKDCTNGWPETQTLILIPIPDWDRLKRAQRTGAHVILNQGNFGAVIRYVHTVADSLVTDRMLGPALVGIHKYTGVHPAAGCEHCEWVDAEVSYGNSKSDLRNLTPIRIVLLNVLLFRYRGQSPAEIENTCHKSRFLRRVSGRHVLRESSIKMEASRLRKHLDDALRDLGVAYKGTHFLPVPAYGANRYCFSGNRRLIHVPALCEPGSSECAAQRSDNKINLTSLLPVT